MCESYNKDASIVYVLPTRGQFDYARACLESLYAGGQQEAQVHVVIVDDASDDWNECWYRDIKGTKGGHIHVIRHARPLGLTAAWNAGIAKTLESGCDIIIAGNSDVLLPTDWTADLLRSMNHATAGVIGPISNAPGVTNHEQDIINWFESYQLSDEQQAIDTTELCLQKTYGASLRDGPVNGFFMAARPTTWKRLAHHVAAGQIFPSSINTMPSGRTNPWPTMAGQEDWLAARCRELNVRMSVAMGLFVFHYRSVSRGERFARGQRWLRRSDVKEE